MSLYRIKNNSNKNISYNAFNYKLQNSNGNIESQTFSTINNDTSLSSGQLAPNGIKIGSIIFEAPKGDNNLILLYQENIFRDKYIKFKLQ